MNEARWWISIVVVGIIVNLVSAYLKSHTDNWLINISKKWATINQKQKQAFLTKVEIVRNSEHEQLMLGLEIIRSLVVGLPFLILGQIFILIGIILILNEDSGILGSGSILIGMVALLVGLLSVMADNNYSVLTEVRKSQKVTNINKTHLSSVTEIQKEKNDRLGQ